MLTAVMHSALRGCMSRCMCVSVFLLLKLLFQTPVCPSSQEVPGGTEDSRSQGVDEPVEEDYPDCGIAGGDL